MESSSQTRVLELSDAGSAQWRTQHFEKMSRFILHFTVLKNQLTPWCRPLPEKLATPQLVKKFPTFYGGENVITFVRTARLLCPYA
jgi:hypothetical protein